LFSPDWGLTGSLELPLLFPVLGSGNAGKEMALRPELRESRGESGVGETGRNWVSDRPDSKARRLRLVLYPLEMLDETSILQIWAHKEPWRITCVV